ncbi:hypothetical protein G4L39_08375 [Limisphaera ngatamarikiensis]|uniref:T2SS protein K first SAM-like domain-containing protein n=1 Tax=Limisphaera ngatamarikiensis TaxID=1324935 RepID=A0A6M1RP18_9BACT|nr:type II secretion system protein GspK [Limisphaera ngatamarikiensis]NGO39413.1 hypothetical protein [Limisphaera ngatamarikiensis]
MSIREPRELWQSPRRGSVLIIVLWVAFGLVALALYFAASMGLELRAADQRVAGIQAELAIQGAMLHVSNLLARVEMPGWPPDLFPQDCEDVPVGEARFWLLGRSDATYWGDTPAFGLVDEASKLNLNTATREMLERLTNLVLYPEVAAAIVDWRDSDSEPEVNGAEDQVYLRLNPPYRCKNAPFETVEELRMVYGVTLELLYGEDANLNGILDPNENDGDTTPPRDNRDGRLQPGLWEYVTVFSRESGLNRTNVNDTQSLAQLLQSQFGAERANQILSRISLGPGPGGPAGPGGGGAPVLFTNLMEFYVRSGMTAEEFDQVYPWLTTTNGVVEGLVNVNTAPEPVLACIPGIDTDGAAALVAYRLSRQNPRASLAWVVEVLGQERALQAGPWLTARSSVYSADVVALGRQDRGYRRVRMVFDANDGVPVVRFRQDLTHLGWALGTRIRQELDQMRESRARTDAARSWGIMP